MSNAIHVRVVFPSNPDRSRVTGKQRGNAPSPTSTIFQKIVFFPTLSTTFTQYNQCLMNFPSSICKFSFYSERLYKNMVIYRRWEKTSFSSLFFSLGISFFFFSVTVCQSSCNCAPIPKMVPHSLNEQKCIGELVRVRVLARVGVKTSQVNSCCPLSPLQGNVALHSIRHKAEPVLGFPDSALWLIRF